MRTGNAVRYEGLKEEGRILNYAFEPSVIRCELFLQCDAWPCLSIISRSLVQVPVNFLVFFLAAALSRFD